jgi:hypothetical protein
MATEKWIAGSGVGFTWTEVFGNELDSLASANSVLSSTAAITNQTALDLFCDFSIAAAGAETTLAPNYIGVYLMPLNQDGSTYGDGVNTTTAAAYLPPSTYYVGSIVVRAAASTFQSGLLRGIIMPPGTFNWVIYNGTGVAFDAAMTAKYRTYNRAVA